MSALRTLMMLALIVWIGGIIFFAFVLAPTVFTVLPSVELAGNVVSRSLTVLHWMGIFSAIVFLICSLLYSRIRYARLRAFTLSNVLMGIMLLLTLISQFAITPRMRVLRAQVGAIDALARNDERRLQFDHLHAWSTRDESAVLLLGLVVVVLTARRFS
jgi:uncharacterized membrane protein